MDEEDEGENEVLEFIEVPIVDKRWNEPIMSGYMTKFSGFVLKKSIWSKRFFILNYSGGELWYFSNEKKNAKPKKNRPVIIKGMKIARSFSRRFCFQIERYPKPFYCIANNGDDFRKWIQKFIQAGAEFTNQMDDSLIPDIFIKQAKDWKTENVLEFVDLLSPNNDLIFLGELYEKNFKGVTGKDLLDIDSEYLIKIGIESHADRFTITEGIRNLLFKNNGRLDVDVFITHRKIVSMLSGKKGGHIPINHLYQYARNLSKPELLYNTYLNIFNLSEFSKAVESSDLGSDDDIKSDDENSNFMAFNKGGEGRKTEKIFFRPLCLRSGIVPVKYFLSEIPRTNHISKKTDLLSPDISRFPNLDLNKNSFGPFKGSLMISEYLMEFNESGLVIPRLMLGSWAQIARKVQCSATVTGERVCKVLKRIAQLICIYNTKKIYSNDVDIQSETFANCQHFVEDMFAALGLYYDINSQIGNVFSRMKKYGEMRPEIEFIDERFNRTFQIKEKKMLFETHAQFDRFVTRCEKEDVIALRTDFPDTLKILKSFDLAFWLRSIKYPDNKTYQVEVEGKKNKNKCCFKDPRLTTAYLLPGGEVSKKYKSKYELLADDYETT